MSCIYCGNVCEHGCVCEECCDEMCALIDMFDESSKEAPVHVCSECGARVSDEFYDKNSGLCTECLKYS